MSIPDINLPPISTDLVILMVLVLVMLYGFVLGRAKLKTLALSVFVGLVMVLTFSEGLFNLIQNANWDFNGRVSLPAVKIGLFALPVIAMEFGKKDGKKSRGIAITLLLSALTAALLVSTVFSFFDSSVATSLTEQSRIADWVYRFRLVWLIGVPVVLISENFIGSKNH